MEDVLLLQLLKKRGVISDRDIHELHELASSSLDSSPVYLSKKIENTELSEQEASDMVNKMYHRENGRKYIGEKYSFDKAKEICLRYRGILPSTVSYIDIYLAINSQYHNYICLFKTWFQDNIDCKIIESAMTYWFMDDDFEYHDKITKMFK